MTELERYCLSSVFEAFKIMSIVSAGIVIAATILTLLARNVVVDENGNQIER